jgi:hypothetical protein
MRPALETLTLFVGLVQDFPLSDLVPLENLSLTGGTLEICTECHAEWIAALKTWFENPTTLREVR